MKHQIRRFGVFQTAMVMGVLYVMLGVIVLPFVYIAASFAPEESGLGTGVAIAMPLIYGVAGFIFGALGSALYNLVAGWVGGIEIELETPGV